MKRIIFLICFSVAATGLQAQDQPASRPVKYQGIFQFGILEGNSGSAFQLQLINGVRYRTFSAGVGVGLDYYLLRSVPVFLDLRTDIFKNGKTPFIYASGGKHFPWQKDLGYDNGWNKMKTEGGWYYDLGVGYSIPLKSQSLFFSAGYSFKSYDEIYETVMPCLWGNCPAETTDYNYKLRRVSVRAGVRF